MNGPLSPARHWPIPGNLIRIRSWSRRNRHQLGPKSAVEIAEAVAAVLDDLRSGRLDHALADLDQLAGDLATADVAPAAELAGAAADLRRALAVLAWLGQCPGLPDARLGLVRP